MIGNAKEELLFHADYHKCRPALERAGVIEQDEQQLKILIGSLAVARVLPIIEPHPFLDGKNQLRITHPT